MNDPSLELQDALIVVLRGNTPLAAIVGARSYDSVPPDANKPYVNLGQPQVLPDQADCVDGAETFFPIHGWATGPQSVVIKQLGKAIAGAVDGVELALQGHRTVLCEVDQIQYLDDPDVDTKHVVVSVRALTESTA